MKKLLLKLKCQKFKNTYLKRHNSSLYLNNSGCVMWHVVCEVLELLHLYIFPAVVSYWSSHYYLWVPTVFTCLSGIHIFLVYLVYCWPRKTFEIISCPSSTILWSNNVNSCLPSCGCHSCTAFLAIISHLEHLAESISINKGGQNF